MTRLARAVRVALLLYASSAGADDNARHLGSGGEVALGQGWITAVPALPFVTHAGIEDALLAGTSHGVFAVWSGGAWVASFVDEPGSKAARVTRMPDGSLAVSVCGRTCRTRVLDAGGVGAPVEVATVRPPQRQERTEPWWVRSLRIHRRIGGVTEHFDLRTLRSRTNPCGTGLSLIGDPRAPFASCSIYTASSLHHFDGARFTAIVEPWSTGWAPSAQAVYEGAGCAPCLVSETILWRDSAGWHQAAAPPGLPVNDLTRRELPTLSIAVIAPGALAVSVGGVSHALVNGTWQPHNQQIVSAIRGTPLRVGANELPQPARLAVDAEPRGFATPSWLVLSDERNGLAAKAWADFLDPGAQPAGVVDVFGVAESDILHVRCGPHASSPKVGSLAADARGVKVLSPAQTLSGQTWRAVELDDGTRGWVNGRYLRPAQ